MTTFSERARPFLTLHMGQAGVQIGNAIWELLCLEHNIQPDGMGKTECPSHGFYDAMFVRNARGHFMPRAIFADTDPAGIGEIRVGPYRDLYSPGQLMSDHNDAGMNYMRGRREFGKYLVPEITERFRWLAEMSSLAPTVFLVHSTGGGTGSGVATSCLETLKSEYGSSLQVLDLSVTQGLSGVQSSSELINSTLYQYESRDLTDVVFSVTNSALFNVCRSGLDRSDASFDHVNRLLAMAFSNLTAMERFPGTVPCSMASICNNLQPFRQLKTPTLACAPFGPADTIGKEDRLSIMEVASAVLEPNTQFADVDLRDGKHMAGVLLFRGAAKPSDVEKTAANLCAKSRVEFVDWAPASFYWGLLELPPLAVPGSGIGSMLHSVTLVSNSTAVAPLFRDRSEAVKKLMKAGGCFQHCYNKVGVDSKVGGGHVGSNEGITTGHNSTDVSTLLAEACDYMDNMVEMYSSEMPPDCAGVKQRGNQTVQRPDSKPASPDSESRTPPNSQSDSKREALVGVCEVSSGSDNRMRNDKAPPSKQSARTINETEPLLRRSSSEERVKPISRKEPPESGENPEIIPMSEGGLGTFSPEEGKGDQYRSDRAEATLPSSMAGPVCTSEIAGMDGTHIETLTHVWKEMQTPIPSQSSATSIDGFVADTEESESSTHVVNTKMKQKGRCCQKSNESAGKGGGGGCCRPAHNRDRRRYSGVQSQNQANSYLPSLIDNSSESLLQMTASSPSVECGCHVVSSSPPSAGCHQLHSDYSNQVAPASENFFEILDIIRDCQPGPALPLVCSARQIIQRNNEILDTMEADHS